MNIYLLLCTLFLVIFQGGFYPQTYIIVGIISALLLVFRKRYVISPVHKALVILTLLYIVSAVVNGMAYSLISKAMLPLTLLIVAILYSTLDKKQKDSLIFYLTVFGIISAIVGIAMYSGLYRNEYTVSGNSFLYTFQYANAAGCFYAVSFLLALFNEKKWIRYSSLLCFIALILTKSIGAVVIMTGLLLIHLIRLGKFNKIKKYVIAATLVFMIAGCFVLYITGANSLLERIIHSYDGLRFLFNNIVFGIGPGNWQYVFPFHQSAYYSAGIIHNSYVQIGVDAGLFAMLISIAFLCLSIYRYKKNASFHNMLALFIMLHSIMEYNLYFAGLDMFVIFLGMYEQVNYENKRQYNKLCKMAAIVSVLLLVFAFYGTMQVRNLESYVRSGDAKKTDTIFKGNYIFMKNGYKENEIYSLYAFKSGISYTAQKKSARYRRYEMIYGKDMDIDTIISYIEEQKNFKNVRIEADKLVDKMTLTEAEKKQYEDYVNRIDDSVEGWIKRLTK